MFLQFLALFCTLIYFVFFYFENFNTNGRPPGPIRIPPFGNLFQVMLQDKLPFVALHKLSKKYGNIMSVKMGLLDTVIISSYEAARQVFSKEEAFGRDCTGVIFDRNLRQDIGLGLIQPPAWYEVRAFCRNALRKYGYENREATGNLLLDELLHLMKDIEEEMATNQGQVTIHSEFFHQSFLNVMLTYVMGKRFNYDHPDFQSLLKFEHALVKNGNLVGAGILIAFPFLRFIFPETLGYNAQMVGISGFQSIAMKFLEERRRGDYLKNPECFTDEFLIKMSEEASQPNTLYTDDHYTVVFSDILQGGMNTTSNVINFTLLQLLSNPEIQEKVYLEICDVVGTARFPNLDDRSLMPYTNAVLLEGLRWSRVFPLGIPRKVTKDFTYRNFRFRKGAVLMFNLHSMFFDEETIEEPQVFRPERFLDMDGNLDKASEISIYFGAGKRNCFGLTLARDSMFMFITTLIQRFKFTLPEGHIPSLEPTIALALYAQPYNAIIKIRDT